MSKISAQTLNLLDFKQEAYRNLLLGEKGIKTRYG